MDRILLVRFSSLGDVVLALYVASALKNQCNAEIFFVTYKRYGPIIEECESINHVFLLNNSMLSIFSLINRLNKFQFNSVHDLHNKPKSIILSKFVKAACHTRMVKRNFPETLKRMSGRYSPLQKGHQIEMYLRSCNIDMDPESILPPLLSFREKLKEKENSIIGLVVGTRHKNKNWPENRFIELAKRIKDNGFSTLFIGGKESLHLREVLKREGFERDTFDLDIHDLMIEIAKCVAVVSPDSGPAHLASAMGIPVVSLFGPTPSTRWRPLSDGSKIIKKDYSCIPCSDHGEKNCRFGDYRCLRDITVDEVYENLFALLT